MIDQAHSTVWWDGMVRMFDEIGELAERDDSAELVELVTLMPRWIAGTKETGRTGCPNVMALALEYARAALESCTPQNAAPVAFGAAYPEVRDISPDEAWARQREAWGAGAAEMVGF